MSVFRRTAYNKLLDWKASNGSRVIMLEGARRVGKSTLAQEFAQSKYKSHLVIDESVASEKRRPETQLVSGLISKNVSWFYSCCRASTSLQKSLTLMSHSLCAGV